jgi:GAF domain-containing protein
MTSAAMAIDEVERLRARLTALEQERKHLLAVIEILQDVGGSLHFAEVVQSVTLRLGETFGLDRCSIFLRTFRDGPSFSSADVQFCQVVANLTAKALRNAHRFERLRRRKGEDDEARRREQEQAALIGFLRRLLAAYPPPSDEEPGLADGVSAEIERLVGVAQAVLSQESAAQ